MESKNLRDKFSGDMENYRNIEMQDFLDRKSVVQGKSVDLGGRRIIKKKKKEKTNV